MERKKKDNRWKEKLNEQMFEEIPVAIQTELMALKKQSFHTYGQNFSSVINAQNKTKTVSSYIPKFLRSPGKSPTKVARKTKKIKAKVQITEFSDYISKVKEPWKKFKLIHRRRKEEAERSKIQIDVKKMVPAFFFNESFDLKDSPTFSKIRSIEDHIHHIAPPSSPSQKRNQPPSPRRAGTSSSSSSSSKSRKVFSLYLQEKLNLYLDCIDAKLSQEILTNYDRYLAIFSHIQGLQEEISIFLEKIDTVKDELEGFRKDQIDLPLKIIQLKTVEQNLKELEKKLLVIKKIKKNETVFQQLRVDSKKKCQQTINKLKENIRLIKSEELVKNNLFYQKLQDYKRMKEILRKKIIDVLISHLIDYENINSNPNKKKNNNNDEKLEDFGYLVISVQKLKIWNSFIQSFKKKAMLNLKENVNQFIQESHDESLKLLKKKNSKKKTDNENEEIEGEGENQENQKKEENEGDDDDDNNNDEEEYDEIDEENDKLKLSFHIKRLDQITMDIFLPYFLSLQKSFCLLLPQVTQQSENNNNNEFKKTLVEVFNNLIVFGYNEYSRNIYRNKSIFSKGGYDEITLIEKKIDNFFIISKKFLLTIQKSSGHPKDGPPIKLEDYFHLRGGEKLLEETIKILYRLFFEHFHKTQLEKLSNFLEYEETWNWYTLNNDENSVSDLRRVEKLLISMLLKYSSSKNNNNNNNSVLISNFTKIVPKGVTGKDNYFMLLETSELDSYFPVLQSCILLFKILIPYLKLYDVKTQKAEKMINQVTLTIKIQELFRNYNRLTNDYILLAKAAKKESSTTTSNSNPKKKNKKKKKKKVILKSISAKHLLLTSESLHCIVMCIPYIFKFIEQKVNMGNKKEENEKLIMLNTFNSTIKGINQHRNKCYDKLFDIMKGVMKEKIEKWIKKNNEFGKEVKKENNNNNNGNNNNEESETLKTVTKEISELLKVLKFVYEKVLMMYCSTHPGIIKNQLLKILKSCVDELEIQLLSEKFALVSETGKKQVDKDLKFLKQSLEIIMSGFENKYSVFFGSGSSVQKSLRMKVEDVEFSKIEEIFRIQFALGKKEENKSEEDDGEKEKKKDKE